MSRPEELLRERLAKGFAPVESGAVEERVRAATCERASWHSRALPFPRRALATLAAAAVLAIAVIAFGAMQSGSERDEGRGGASDNAILQRAAAAVREGGVLHYTLRIVDGPGVTQDIERWIDEDAQLTREETTVTHEGVTSHQSRLWRGRWMRQVGQAPGRPLEAGEFQDLEAHQDDAARMVAFLRQGIADGIAKVVRRETVAGVETWRIEMSLISTAPNVVKGTEVDWAVANVSTRDYTPVRIETGDDALGGGNRRTSRVWDFGRFERLTLPPGVFELPLPAGVKVGRYGFVAPSETTTWTEPAVWWLGDGWDGMKLLRGRVAWFESPPDPVGPPRPDGWPRRSLRVDYTLDERSPSSPALMITIVPRLDETLWSTFVHDVLGGMEGRPAKYVLLDGIRTLEYAQRDQAVLVSNRGDETVLIQVIAPESVTTAENAAKALRRMR